MKYIHTLCCSIITTAIFFSLLLTGQSHAAERTDVLTLDGSASQFQWNKQHFPHTNPDAPKGGTLLLYARGSFDSLQSFIPRGMQAAGLGFTYETLGRSVPDSTLFETYGLVAEEFLVADDGLSMSFFINPKARFHDGVAMTSEDVAYTFNTLIEKGSPSYRQYYASVASVETPTPQEVRFIFKEKNKELPIILAQLPVLPKHYWEKNEFDKPSLTPPLGSGPYRIKSFAAGSYIEFERVQDYWAQDLPVNKGRFNFNTVRYEYYRDATVAREGFKAGAFDLYVESTAKAWATAYTGKAIDDGHIVRENVPSNRPMGMYGFFFNTRRPMLSDKKVRQALSLLFDFEWTNKALFYDEYTRSTSYFSNSTLASTGLPTKEELVLLQPFADELPAELFTQAFTLPVTKADGNIRPQMIEALALLQEAGWSMKDGRMQNAQGEQLEYTILLTSSSLQRIILPYRSNLERLGIILNIAMVDQTQYINRVRAFDYDIIITRVGQSSHPGNEQREYWSGASASMDGSKNYSGIQSAAVDALIDHIINANDAHELTTACHALDRVLLWNHYVIPGWYSSTSRVAYWNKFAHSDTPPADGLDILSWWVDPEAEKILLNSQTGYGKR